MGIWKWAGGFEGAIIVDSANGDWMATPASDRVGDKIIERVNALAGVPDPAALMAAVRECVAADEQFQAALVKPKHGESIMAAEDRLFAALRRLGEVVGK
jgi:hypothetical protein